jgi:hypothetical protein
MSENTSDPSVHTGERGKPNWTGTVKGLPGGIRDYGQLVPTTPKMEPEELSNRVRKFGRAVLGEGAFLAVALAVVTAPVVGFSNTAGWGKVAVGAGTAVALVVIAASIYGTRRRYSIPSRLSAATAPLERKLG